MITLGYFYQHSMTCKEIPLVTQNGMYPKKEPQTKHVASQWRISKLNFNIIKNCSCPCSLMKLIEFHLVACVHTQLCSGQSGKSDFLVKWQGFPCSRPSHLLSVFQQRDFCFNLLKLFGHSAVLSVDLHRFL